MSVTPPPPTVRVDLTAEDLVRLHALTQFGGAFIPSDEMKHWCMRFYLRLLPLRVGIGPSSPQTAPDAPGGPRPCP